MFLESARKRRRSSMNHLCEALQRARSLRRRCQPAAPWRFSRSAGTRGRMSASLRLRRTVGELRSRVLIVPDLRPGSPVSARIRGCLRTGVTSRVLVERALPPLALPDIAHQTLRDRRGETLFIDARKLGALVDRTHRELSEVEIARIAKTYHAWRGEKDAGKYADVAGFCKSAKHSLTVRSWADRTIRDFRRVRAHRAESSATRKHLVQVLFPEPA